MLNINTISYIYVSDGLPQLIFTNGGDVMIADIHGRIVRTLVPTQNKGHAVGVAYHWHSSTVFWSDKNNQKVSLHFSFLHAVSTFSLLQKKKKTLGLS